MARDDPNPESIAGDPVEALTVQNGRKAFSTVTITWEPMKRYKPLDRF